MRYLLTDKNHKPDFAFQNALYFDRVIDRDNYINSLFNEPINYMNSINGDVINNAVNQDGSGTITIKPNLSRQELYDKNYIILRECGLEKPEFFFITNIRPIESKPGEYILDLQKDVITSNPGFMNDSIGLELLEGHMSETSLLDMTFDGGYKTSTSIRPLDRTFSGSVLDRGLIDNQWIYAFVSKPGPDDTSIPGVSSSKFFKYNGQLLPYRLLVAPVEPILMKSGSRISLVNKLKSFRNDTLSTLSFDSIPTLQDLDETKSVKLVFNQSLDIPSRNEDDGSFVEVTKKDLEIPADKFVEFYKDKWGFVGFRGSTGDTKTMMNEFWNDLPWTDLNVNDLSQSTQDTKQLMTGILMKYNSTAKSFEFKGIEDEDFTSRDKLLKSVANAPKAHSYQVYRRSGTGYSLSSLNFENTYLDSEILTQKNTYEIEFNKYTVESRYSYFTTEYGGIAAGETYSATNNPFKKLEIEQIYQGEKEGSSDEFWTKDELIDLINNQYSSNNGDGLLGVKLSSFNPLVLDQNGNILNVIKYDRDQSTAGGWVQQEVIEILTMTSSDIPKLNTYDLTPYQDKSWIKGINNYSIMIENNKEFDIKPEYTYLYPTFVHEVVPTPNEWVERLRFRNDIHSEEYEYINRKEIIVGSNVLGNYKLNNPGALENQQYNNNMNLLTTVIGSSSAIAAGIASGGASSILTGSGVVGGVSGAINNIKSRKNLKHNVAMMNNQPPISSGTGSAYGDLYLNKYGFRLCIVEWIYTTNQGRSTVESIIRNGVRLNQSTFLTFEDIRGIEFNYMRIANGLEALSSVELNNAEKSIIADILELGTRFWYNPENFLDYTVDNGNTIFTRDMINTI